MLTLECERQNSLLYSHLVSYLSFIERKTCFSYFRMWQNRQRNKEINKRTRKLMQELKWRAADACQLTKVTSTTAVTMCVQRERETETWERWLKFYRIVIYINIKYWIQANACTQHPVAYRHGCCWFGWQRTQKERTRFFCLLLWTNTHFSPSLFSLCLPSHSLSLCLCPSLSLSLS